MTIFNKIKWMGGILLVFFLVLATNLIDKDNLAKVEQSVETIYEEILMTKNKVMEMSDLIHEKEVAYLMNDSLYYGIKGPSVNEHISYLVSDCGQVVRSDREEKVLTDLQANCDILFEMETDSAIVNAEGKLELIQQIELVKINIKELSDVQLEEGKKQKLHSREAMDTTKLFTRIEIYLLIVMAIILQLIVLYSPKKKTSD